MTSSMPCDGHWCTEPTWQQTRRLLYHKSPKGADPAYARPFFIPILLHIEGHIDVLRLQEALNAVVVRHEALRYLFHEHPGRGWRVTSTEHFCIPLTKVSPSSAIGQAMWNGDNLAGLLGVSARFAISKPIHLASYLSSDGNAHRLLMVVDHLIADWHSVMIICRDLADFYRRNVKAADVEPDRTGRAAIANIALACAKASVPEELSDLAREMRASSQVAWVDLPVRQSWEVPRQDAVATLAALTFGPDELDRVCVSWRSTRFSWLIAAVMLSLRERSSNPGYIYIYPSLREVLDGSDTSRDTVGWLGGTGLLQFRPTDATGMDLVRKCMLATAEVMDKGWAVCERLSAYTRLNDRAAAKPSVCVENNYRASQLWDFGTASAAALLNARPWVSIRGRLSFGLMAEAEGMYVRISHEPERFDPALIEHLAARTAWHLEEMFSNARQLDTSRD